MVLDDSVFVCVCFVGVCFVCVCVCFVCVCVCVCVCVLCVEQALETEVACMHNVSTNIFNK